MNIFMKELWNLLLKKTREESNIESHGSNMRARDNPSKTNPDTVRTGKCRKRYKKIPIGKLQITC